MDEHYLGKMKALCLDLDGTLLNSEKQITQNAKNWIIKYMQRGGVLIFASARKIREILPFANELMFSLYEKAYIVSSNGTDIWNVAKNQHYQFTCMPTQTLEQVIKVFISNKALPTIVTPEMDYLVHNRITIIDILKNIKYRIREDKSKIINQKHVTKMNEYVEKVFVNDIDTQYADEFSHIPGIRTSIIDRRQFGIYAEGVNKFFAVEKIIKDENIKPDEVLVFGDDDNDTLVFEHFPNSVAMGNSTSGIMQLARFKTVSNEDDGVFLFLDENSDLFTN